MSKMDEILLSAGKPSEFVKEPLRQNGKPKHVPFDPYQYEYYGYAGTDRKPAFICRKCNADLTWIKRVIHRVFFSAYVLYGDELKTEGLWSNLDAVISLRRHYGKVGYSEAVPFHPRQTPVPLIEKGLCIKCRKPEPEERSLF